MEKDQIKWVDDVSRFKQVCLRHENNSVQILGPATFTFSVECLHGETPDELKEKLAVALAGKNIGDTERILKTI